MPDSPQSPRLTRLKGELDTDNRGALDAFWAEVAHEGAPLVEPVEGDSTGTVQVWQARP